MCSGLMLWSDCRHVILAENKSYLGLKLKICFGVGVDADDEGEESAQKSSSGSDTPSEVGEEVSASEQSGDEQSEHDEEEEEQEGKAESEGEAEGMTDVDDGDGDGNSSLADSEHSYARCKPLAAYPGTGTGLVGVSNWKKGGRIFYGNDTFYVLFRFDLESLEVCLHWWSVSKFRLAEVMLRDSFRVGEELFSMMSFVDGM